jgi:hypothetical protein
MEYIFILFFIGIIIYFLQGNTLLSNFKTEYFLNSTSQARDVVIPAPVAVPVKKIDIELPKLSTTLTLDNYTQTKPSTEQEARATVGTVRSQVEYSKIYPIGINFDAQFNNYNNLLSNTSISILNEILTNTQYKANEKSSIINFNSGFKQVQSLLVTENDVLDYGNYIVSLMNGVSNNGNSFLLKKVIPITKEQYESQIRLNFQIEVLYKYPKSNKNQVELVPKEFTILLNTIMLFEKNATNIEHFKSSFSKSISSASKTVAKGTTSTAKTVAKGTTSTAKTVAKGTTSTAKIVAKGTTSTATTVAKGTTDAAKTVAKGTTDAAKTVAKGTTDAAKTVAKGATSATKSIPSNVKIYLETLSLLGISNYGFLPGYQK